MRKRQQKEKQSTRQIDESNINKMDNRSSSNSLGKLWNRNVIE